VIMDESLNEKWVEFISKFISKAPSRQVDKPSMLGFVHLPIG
jgi:hypothetical protein